MYYFITCLSVYENTFDLGDKNHIFFRKILGNLCKTIKQQLANRFFFHGFVWIS